MNQENTAALLSLLASLDETMSVALTEGSLASASLASPRPHGLEMFLCALYCRHPDKLLPYFSGPAGFKSLKDALWPAKFPSNPPGTSDSIDETVREPNTAPGYHIELDPKLARILLNASRISFALLNPRTSIVDLVASIAIELEVRESLSSRWGISLRGLPPGGKQTSAP